MSIPILMTKMMGQMIISPISARETKVMATFIAPMPRVADWL